MKRMMVFLVVGFALVVGAAYYFTTYNPFLSDSQVFADKATHETNTEAIHHQKIMECLKDSDCAAAMKQKEIDRKADETLR